MPKFTTVQVFGRRLPSYKTRSYFSGGNSVSFPERYLKSEKGWDFDILRMRVWGDLCKYVALRALIRLVARAHAL